MNPALGTVACLAVLSGGCAGNDLLSPLVTEAMILHHGQMRVTLTVTPDVLEPPGTVLAALTYENLGSDTIVLVSGYGCLSFAAVYLDDERIPFPATDYGCTTAVSHRDLEPGEPIRVEWPLVIGGEEGVQAVPGTYRFVADLNTHANDLERTFVVR